MSVDSIAPHGPACSSCGETLPEGSHECPTCAGTLPAQAPGRTSQGLLIPEIEGFTILGRLGAGGMGIVFEALDTRMDRRVALKVLTRDEGSSDRAGLRFAREAWIGGTLNHPNLVKVYTRGRVGDLDYFSMELVEGGSLAGLVERMGQTGKDDLTGLQFGTHEYSGWVIRQAAVAARTLDYAHRKGVIHRDIKPRNILLAKEPVTIKIADFGLAALADATRVTTEGKVFGTVAYMSPEQIRGRQAEIDSRCDIYALTVTLFELLTLRLPFRGETQQIYMDAVLTREPLHASNFNRTVSRDLETVVKKGLEKRPQDRYASAAALAEDLEAVLGFRPIRARLPSPPARLLKWVRRRPLHAALAGSLILGIPTVASLWILGARREIVLRDLRAQEMVEEAWRAGREGRQSEAIDLLSQVIELEPSHLKALRDRALNRLRLAESADDPDRGRELLREARVDLSSAVAAAPQASWPYRLRALVHSKLGDRAAAEEDERQAAARRSENPSAQEREMDAILAMEQEDPAMAIEIYSQILLQHPDFVEARMGRAAAFEETGETGKAIADYEFAAGFTPGDFYPQYCLGFIKTELGSLDEAETHYRRALELAPRNPHVLDGLAHTQVEQARSLWAEGNRTGSLSALTDAEQNARKALHADPMTASAALNLGAALQERARIEIDRRHELIAEAASHYESVLAMRERDPESIPPEIFQHVLVNQCDAHIQLSRLDEALEACRRVVGLTPDDPVGHYNLAGVYALRGDPVAALEELEQDLALGDTDHEYLRSDPWFESLHANPEFDAILEKMEHPAARE